MSFAKVYGIQNNLLNAQIIDIEVDISVGLHRFDIVGMTDKAVDEARSRTSSAIKNSGFDSPKQTNQKIVVSLAPAQIKKNGTIFDLAIALCYLKATSQIDFNFKNRLFVGELSLDGKLRPVSGVLPMVLKARELGFKEIFLPKENAKEAAIVKGIDIFGGSNLNQIIDHINLLDKKSKKIPKQPKTKIEKSKIQNDIILENIKGNEFAKRALIVALCGGHNICFYGPPGTGKTMLAKASQSLLPDLSFDQVLEVTSLYSVSGQLNGNIKTKAPFRSPHHTSSHAAIIGGGSNIKPGEITLAHRGVLFLDEFTEFDRRVIDSLRQPIEDKKVKISRVKESVDLPSDFLLIVSMNPCPCGFYGYDNKVCSCSASQIMKYQKKISGPIMDRIDIWVEVSAVDYQKLVEQTSVDFIQDDTYTIGIKRLIQSIRDIQKESNKECFDKDILNGALRTDELEKVLDFDRGVKEFFDESAKKLNLSARSYTKILKISKTISQINNENLIKREHVLEALSWRPNSKFFL